MDRRATKAHLACDVEDPETARRALAAGGFEALESAPIPGYDRFETYDPFGNRVELLRRPG